MGGGGAGGFDPSSMQDMMKNPSLTGLLGNPDFLQTALTMLKSPQSQSMVQGQNPGMNMNLLVKALEVIVKISQLMRWVKRAWASIYVRLAVFGVLIMIVAYFFN